MLPTPKKYTLVVGIGEGRTRLTAFDKALLDAGIGNLNLLKVSSILPPDCQFVEQLTIPPGSLTPTAYGALVSDVPGEVISAAIGVGVGRDSFGVIMEFSGRCSKAEAEERVGAMVREAFEIRDKELAEVKTLGVETTVENVSCAFAAAALWY